MCITLKAGIKLKNCFVYWTKVKRTRTVFTLLLIICKFNIFQLFLNVSSSSIESNAWKSVRCPVNGIRWRDQRNCEHFKTIFNYILGFSVLSTRINLEKYIGYLRWSCIQLQKIIWAILKSHRYMWAMF